MVDWCCWFGTVVSSISWQEYMVKKPIHPMAGNEKERARDQRVTVSFAGNASHDLLPP
jgi:hypothetical protein